MTLAALSTVLLLVWMCPAVGQFVGSVSLRPFVAGLIPVIGPRGAVGGVSIDAQGVVTRSNVEVLGELRETRRRALNASDTQLHAASPLRKISLRCLQAEIEQRWRKELPVTEDLQNLAGLTRVQFVFLYPEQGDIVLAGPAEGWKVDEQGNLVGLKTGQPIMQLDDLVVALRTAKAAAMPDGITCSIDPSQEGVARLQRLLTGRSVQISETNISRMEQLLGPQQITVTGVPPGSHFARVLVAADFMMKRLGMNFEAAPVEGLPSYMHMLEESSATAPRAAIPRFWMAASYEPLLRDAEGLAWRLQGPGVKTLADDGPMTSSAAKNLNGRQRGKSLAEKWADSMTAKYEPLSTALPIFAELRNCMDLAVISALLVKENLPGKSRCDLSLLLDEKRVQVAEYEVPKTVDSRASLVKKGRQWIVGVSGGVEIDSWSILDRVEVDSNLANARMQSTPETIDRWWWD
jgi:hypothetical protein